MRGTTMNGRLRALWLCGSALLVSGCGTTAVLHDQHEVFYSTGGEVFQQSYGPQKSLPGATVMLTAADGRIFTSTTDDAGLWSVAQLGPGTYSVSYAMTGFTTIVRTLDLS